MSDRLKVAVCDDEAHAISVISASIESVFRGYGTEIALESFTAPAELLDRLRSHHFDLIFLDISMPEMDGIELGKQLQRIGSNAELIFVSSRMDRVFDTFAVQPFGFVRKNHFLEDIGEVIARYEESRRVESDDSRLAHFKDQQGMVAIDVTHVTYIECIRNTQVLHFDDSDREHRLYSRMETLEEELKRFDFLRVHKGYLVACKFIRRFDSKAVILTTGEEIPIGRSRRQESMDAYLSYIGRTGSTLIGKSEQ